MHFGITYFLYILELMEFQISVVHLSQISVVHLSQIPRRGKLVVVVVNNISWNNFQGTDAPGWLKPVVLGKPT
jgi:hypothetical protein